jgi:hypothetical protein
LFERVMWPLGLTCDFWAENDKRKMARETKVIHSATSVVQVRGGRRTGLGWDVDRAYWMGLHPMLFANSRQTFSDA